MSELKIEVSEEIKKQTVIQGMKDFLNSLPKIEIKKVKKEERYYHDDVETKEYNIYDQATACGVSLFLAIHRFYGWKEVYTETIPGGFRKEPQVKKNVYQRSDSIFVGTIDLKDKTIHCNYEPDFENLEALARKFKFRILYKNWPGAK
jgi:hypothetical protein